MSAESIHEPYDGGDEKGLPIWSEDLIDLGRPAAMDGLTLIEYIQRQIETPEETAARGARRAERHERWHQTAVGIYACCLRGYSADKMVLGTLDMAKIVPGEMPGIRQTS